MSCPVCGEECHCSNAQAAPARRLPPRFRISSESHAEYSAEAGGQLLVDKPASDSLYWGSDIRPRFMMAEPENEMARAASPIAERAVQSALAQAAHPRGAATNSLDISSDERFQPEFSAIACRESTREAPEPGECGCPDWRDEVTARVNKYHSRRKRREPRYPSLRLKFDPPEYTRPTGSDGAALGVAFEAPTQSSTSSWSLAQVQVNDAAAGRTGQVAEDLESNVIEFPRPFVPEPPPPGQLAEPVPDKPRILEAPEAVPKQVPLGGIIIEPEEVTEPAGEGKALAVAPLPMRALAAVLDAALVGLGVTAFLAIASHFSHAAMHRDLPLVWGVLPCCLWLAYQYTFLVQAGTTPGLRVARLQLRGFDGTAPDARQRRARVLAIGLSAVSLGLGFLWALIDEESFCWHDRITCTMITMDGEKHSGLLMRLFGPDSRLHRLLQDRIPQPPVS